MRRGWRWILVAMYLNPNAFFIVDRKEHMSLLYTHKHIHTLTILF